jgi:hypothetical protein
MLRFDRDKLLGKQLADRASAMAEPTVPFRSKTTRPRLTARSIAKWLTPRCRA